MKDVQNISALAGREVAEKFVAGGGWMEPLAIVSNLHPRLKLL